MLLTLFDIPPARYDSFVRADRTGWGSASDGNLWAHLTGSVASGTIAIESNEGVVRNSTSTAWQGLGPAIDQVDTEGLVRFTWGGGATENLGIILRSDGSAVTYMLARYVGATGMLNVLSKVSGTTLTNLSTPLALVGGTPYWMRFRFQGSRFMVRVWQDGTAEPTTWQLSGIDTNFPTAGIVGIYSFGATTGNSFDHFQAMYLAVPVAYPVGPGVGAAATGFLVANTRLLGDIIPVPALSSTGLPLTPLVRISTGPQPATASTGFSATRTTTSTMSPGPATASTGFPVKPAVFRGLAPVPATTGTGFSLTGRQLQGLIVTPALAVTACRVLASAYQQVGTLPAGTVSALAVQQRVLRHLGSAPSVTGTGVVSGPIVRVSLGAASAVSTTGLRTTAHPVQQLTLTPATTGTADRTVLVVFQNIGSAPSTVSTGWLVTTKALRNIGQAPSTTGSGAVLSLRLLRDLGPSAAAVSSGLRLLPRATQDLAVLPAEAATGLRTKVGFLVATAVPRVTATLTVGSFISASLD